MRSNVGVFARERLLLGLICVLTTSCVVAAQVRDGDFDGAFGTLGKAFFTYPGNLPIVGGWYVGPALQSDGKLLIAASRYTTPTNADFGVMRLLPNGSIDSGFGTGGAATRAFDRANSTKVDRVSGMALQGDGKILVAGTIDGDTSTGTDMAVVRFTSAGQADTFGSSGKAIVQFNLGNCASIVGACDDQALRVNVQSDGKILLVGQATTTQVANTPTSAMALARLTSTGIRDTGFGTAGRVALTFANGDAALAFQARQLADGQHILMVGTANLVAQGSNDDFALAKLDDQGHLDPTFGSGGKVTYGFDIGGNLQDLALDFIELADGKLVVCGFATVNAPDNTDFACMRFLANGAPDPAFTPVLVPFDLGDTYHDEAVAMQRDSQGRYLLVGYALRVASNADMAIVRLTVDGALDTSFGQGGTKTINSKSLFSTSEYDNAALGVVIQPDEKIIVAGTAVYDVNGSAQFEVVRLYGDTIFQDDFEVH